MKQKLKIYISGILIFIASFVFSFFAINISCVYIGFYPHGIPNIYLPLFCSLTFFLPMVVGFFVSRYFIIRIEKLTKTNTIWFPKNKTFRAFFAGLYLLTIVAGIPSIYSHNTKWAVEEYKNQKASGDKRVWESHPYLGTYFTVPVFPFVIVSYHEFQLTGLYGFGGWDIQLWHINGVIRIIKIPLWVS